MTFLDNAEIGGSVSRWYGIYEDIHPQMLLRVDWTGGVIKQVEGRGRMKRLGGNT